MHLHMTTNYTISFKYGVLSCLSVETNTCVPANEVVNSPIGYEGGRPMQQNSTLVRSDSNGTSTGACGDGGAVIGSGLSTPRGLSAHIHIQNVAAAAAAAQAGVGAAPWAVAATTVGAQASVHTIPL